MSKVIHSVVLTGVLLFIFSAGFPPLDDAAEVDLTTHMLQHFLIIFAGVMIAYPLLGRRVLSHGIKKGVPLLALGGTMALVVFWHLPGPWDWAVIDPGVHVVEHFCFLGIGMLCGSVLLGLSDSGKLGALLAAFFGHMGYAVALISPWNLQVYSQYTLGNQQTLGWILLLTGPTLLIGVFYIIASNPTWLSGMGGVGEPSGRAPRKRPGTPGWVSVSLSLFLAMAMVGYFSYAAYSLSTGPAGPRESVVYIDETPVSWQYSPQNLTVVLGINSTVTWVSHSISFDTVTAQDGSFSSGAIAPGQSYAFTFAKAGVYDYYCMYHPWMKGTVTVVS